MNTENYNQINECSGDDSMLGSVNDPNSVAWLLQQIFNYIKILGPLLVVVLSSVEFAKVIIQSDDEAMAKAQKKLITRIIFNSYISICSIRSIWNYKQCYMWIRINKKRGDNICIRIQELIC